MSTTPRRSHPWVFMILEVPYGVGWGYIAVTLAYQLKHSGGSVSQIAGLVALSYVPNVWKFFWPPVVDITLTQKNGYALSGILSAAGIAAMGFFPASKAGLVALSGLALFTGFANSVLGMS